MKNIRLIIVSFTLCFTSNVSFAHSGHGDELPWQACDDAVKGDYCEYVNSHNDLYQGSCRVFSEALMCVRNKPIVQLDKTRVNQTSKTIDIKSVVNSPQN